MAFAGSFSRLTTGMVSVSSRCYLPFGQPRCASVTALVSRSGSRSSSGSAAAIVYSKGAKHWKSALQAAAFGVTPSPRYIGIPTSATVRGSTIAGNRSYWRSISTTSSSTDGERVRALISFSSDKRLKARADLTMRDVLQLRWKSEDEQMGVTPLGGFPICCTSVPGSCSSILFTGNGINNGPPTILKGRQRYFSTTSSTDGERVGQPKYGENDSARVFFSNKYFYPNEVVAIACADLRTKILGEMTMHEVQQQWKSEKQRKALADSIGAPQDKVIAALIPVLVEDQLDNEIVPINGAPEIETIAAKHVPRVPSAITAMDSVSLSALLKSRSRPIFLVMGPSGAGKTFASVKEIATHHVSSLGHTKHVTLYVKPNAISEFINANDSIKEKVLMDHIKQSLSKQYPSYNPEQKLNMHATLVLDEIQIDNDFFDRAGDKRLIDFFDSQLKHFADGVRLVACGTGLTGENLQSDTECFKIHLNRWTRKDVANVLPSLLKPDENPNHILNAIFNQPVLEALTTNARAAGFLLEEIVNFKKRLANDYIEQDELIVRLNDAMPFIFSVVVSRYVEMNGIQSLKAEGRRCVAATVLGAVENARTSDKLNPPNLEGLNTKEKSVAWSLLDHNIEYSSTKSPQLVRKNERPITVSSAVAVVLFSMLETSARIFTTWKAQERISALYAFRQEVLKYLGRFGPSGTNCRKDFDNHLANLRLVQVLKPVPPTNCKYSFEIPKFTKNVIWINGDKARFADVIAPYMLIQCKHSIHPDKALEVDLSKELSKCGLLRNDDPNSGGRVALRAIWAMWSGRYKHHDMNLKYTATKAEGQSLSVEMQQTSVAFPENMLGSRTIDMNFEPVTVSLKKGTWRFMDRTKNPELPELSHFSIPDPREPRISFVISTNKSRISVRGKGGKLYVLCRDDLHEDGRVNKDIMKTRDKVAWEKFEAEIVHGVDVKFLFT